MYYQQQQRRLGVRRICLDNLGAAVGVLALTTISNNSDGADLAVVGLADSRAPPEWTGFFALSALNIYSYVHRKYQKSEKPLVNY